MKKWLEENGSDTTRPVSTPARSETPGPAPLAGPEAGGDQGADGGPPVVTKPNYDCCGDDGSDGSSDSDFEIIGMDIPAKPLAWGQASGSLIATEEESDVDTPPITSVEPVGQPDGKGIVAKEKPSAKTAEKGPAEANTGRASEFYGHPFEAPEPFDGVLSIHDQNAPIPKVGEHDLSPAAIRQRATRIFTPRVDGTLKVSEVIYREWKGKGKERKLLEQIFRQCGYSPESCL